MRRRFEAAIFARAAGIEVIVLHVRAEEALHAFSDQLAPGRAAVVRAMLSSSAVPVLLIPLGSVGDS